MAGRSAAQTRALLGLHHEREPRAVLRGLVRYLAPEYGRALACLYLPQRTACDLRLELLEDSAGEVTARDWGETLAAPVALPAAAVLPALTRLAESGDQATVSERPADLLGSAWPAVTGARDARFLGMRQVVLAPLVTDEDAVGLLLVLLLDNRPSAAAAECAAHAAVALAHLRRQRRDTRSASEIVMRSVIEEVAARELNRAERYDRLLSVAVVDLQEPDRVPWKLAATAALVTSVMRLPDTAGTLDNGRLVVLLPETGAEGAATFLRRLGRQATPDLGALRCATATFPLDGTSLDALVCRAVFRLDDPQPELRATRPGRGYVSLHVTVTPVAEGEAPRWLALLERMGSVSAIALESFDRASARFTVRTPSAARLLGELRQLAAKVGGALTPTIDGEVGLQLRDTIARVPVML
jgi:hypothetical protein